MSIKDRSTRTRRTKGGTLTSIIGQEMGSIPTGIKNVVVAAPNPPAPPAPKRKINHVIYLLDDSGSMSSCYAEAVRQLNANFANLREQVRVTGQETDVSLYLFGGNSRVTRRFSRIPANLVVDLNPNDFACGSHTPLFDAVGISIDDARTAPAAWDADETFLLVCATDGGENSSKRYGNRWDTAPFRQVIREAQDTDRWTLAFLVPPGHKHNLIGYGVPEGNIVEWENTREGARTAFNSVAAATSSYYATRSRGATATKSFFTTDLSSVTKRDLSKMDDLSRDFRVWKIEKEIEIRPFVEGRGAKFVLGAGYYQLTKKELLRAGRKLLIREKGTRRIYGGDDARSLLGLPAGPVQVTPGNHANFDLFFQSTSYNRHLVRGTELLWDATKSKDDGETWPSAAAEAAAQLKKIVRAY